MGHSDGGSIALIYGAGQPELLKGIITEAAHVFVEDVTIEGIEAAERAYESGRLKGLSRYHGAKTATIFKAWADTWRSTGFEHWNIEYLLPSITAPLLAVQGRDDQYGTLDQINSIVGKAAGPSDPLVVADCGHVPHLEQPQVVVEAMARFVDRIKEN